MELWQFYQHVWEAVQWLRGWALALRDEAVKQKAVKKARRVKHCRL
jgi:hypothetical protein